MTMLLVSAACRQEQKPTASDVVLDMTVSDLQVGETLLTVRVSDKQGKMLAEPGILSLRGDMDHAGMVPVLAEADNAVEGVFNVPFEWTMGGSWRVEASLALSADEVARQVFRFDVVSPSTNQAMAHDNHAAMNDAKMDAMTHDDHAGMGDMAMADTAGATSAAYLQIANRGRDDIALVSAASAAAAMIEFHETRVADGVASMKRLDKLVVPGESEVELAPGGMHLMLMNLTDDLHPDDNFTLELTSSAGQLYRIDFQVGEPPSSDLADSVVVGDLAFKNRWARPASAG
ncbi:MAG: copper chaperone PCu(A)C [Chloroflexi bacterium]|nr:copper chaperone PCu(A)C [Chloroflexota bacterium]MCY4247829.1 copper chaperone PCu(A)C [Chloroflexota bacterium]